MSKEKKIGVFYDTFTNGGGAERVAAMIANHFNAELVTCGYRKELYKDWIKCKVKDLGNFSAKFSGRIGLLEAMARFALNRKNFDYDFYLFSGFASIFAAKGNRPNAWLCHTPNRTLYDLKEKRLKELNFFQKILWNAYIKLLEPLDQRVVKRDLAKVVAGSKNSHDRLKKFYGLNSEILYSPVDTEKYYFKEFGDFFLTVGRLVPEKRMPLIAEAFSEMPGKKLVIVGFGEEEKKVEEICSKAENIEFKKRVGEKELLGLYARCLATVYMPYNEDHGLIPLEGNASGKACIAVNEGGMLETVLHGKTGFLIPAKKEEIQKTVKGFSKQKAEEMKNSCIEWSKNFSLKEYLKKWEKIVR